MPQPFDLVAFFRVVPKDGVVAQVVHADNGLSGEESAEVGGANDATQEMERNDVKEALYDNFERFCCVGRNK